MRTGLATAFLVVVALGVVAVGLGATPAGAQDSTNATIVEVSLAGTTAENVTIDDAASVRQRVAAELGISSTQVAVVDTDGSTALEIQRSDVSPDQLREALSAAGVGTGEATIRTGVTAQTGQRTATILEGRLSATDGHNGTVVRNEQTRLFVRVTGDPDRAFLEQLVQRGDVTISARTPDGETTQLLTNEDIRQTRSVLDGENASVVPVRLTDAGATRFSQQLRQLNFTGEGVNACEGKPAPNATGYCLVTSLNGDIVATGGVNAELAEVVDFGTFTEKEWLGVVAGNATQARATRLGMLSIPIETETSLTGVDVELPTNETTRTPTPSSGNGTTTTTSGSSGPGFTPVVAVLGVLGAVLLARRTT